MNDLSTKKATIHDDHGHTWTEHWSLHDGGPGVCPGELMLFDEDMYLVTATNVDTDEVWVRKHPQAERIRRAFKAALFYNDMPTNAGAHVAMFRAQLEHGRWLAEELARVHPKGKEVWTMSDPDPEQPANKQTMFIGMRVKAGKQITEGGVAGDENAKFPAPNYIHANPGDLGIVEHIDKDGDPTVRFDRTRTATIVGRHEIHT